MISKIKTSRIELINVDTVVKDKSFQATSQPIFAGEMMVVIKMIDNLSSLDVAIIDIASLGSPLEIKELGINILVLKPALLSECFSKLVIPSLYDVNFLIKPTPVSLLPSVHVHILLLGLLLLLLFSTVHIHIVSILYL